MKKVLLVNDSKLQNAVMKDILSSLNYEVRVTDEFNAISVIHDFSPHYVITNYVMKEINGDQLAAVIKVQYPDIKCLISSSNSIDSNKFSQKKIDGIIRVPIDRENLKMILESISTDNVKDYDDANDYEVKKYCSQCGKFVDFSLNDEYYICPFCGKSIN